MDKPEGCTSHDVVSRVRRITDVKRVGHLGTLDPVATGVLPLLIGRATRLSQFYTRSDKVYEAIVRFGFATDTYDRTGAPTTAVSDPLIDRQELERHLECFRGEIEQTPPPVSAKKIDGVRAYKLARKQIAVELSPVRVRVYSLDLLDLRGREASLRAHCSGGTYMRSIAHDLGVALGTGAHLHSLRRIASGEFTIEQAHSLAAIEELASAERLMEILIPAAKALPAFPTVYVEPVVIGQIRHGQNFPVSPFRVQAGSRYVKAVSHEGELVAIGEARLPNLYHPIVVL